MKVQVLVRLKSGVLDVQGKAVENGVASMGAKGISHLRIGRLIEFDIDADSLEAAKPTVDRLCKDLFANPIIETYEIRAVEHKG